MSSAYQQLHARNADGFGLRAREALLSRPYVQSGCFS